MLLTVICPTRFNRTLENRARFLFEVIDAIVLVWNADQIAVRLSPGSTYGTMFDSDPHATFGYVARRLDGYGLAYLHVVEPRVRGNDDIAAAATAISVKDLRRVYKGTLIAAGAFTADSARRMIETGDADLVAFGRLFVSNPDLPERLRVGAPLNQRDRSTFYGGNARGYTDYSFHSPAPVA
ncbi:oxidoreductase [Caballeronia sp. HLA56]